MMQRSLFARRMLVVSGKGGVGRTTTAAALSIAAARMGKRVLLAQMDAHDRLAQLFDRHLGELQGVRHSAADACVQRAPDAGYPEASDPGS